MAAAIGIIGICGAVFTTALAAMFSGPKFFSVFATSGATALSTACSRTFGAAALGDNCNCGFGTGALAAHCTIFGNSGSIFGGVMGAAG